jgi:hypothetical protein
MARIGWEHGVGHSWCFLVVWIGAILHLSHGFGCGKTGLKLGDVESWESCTLHPVTAVGKLAKHSIFPSQAQEYLSYGGTVFSCTTVHYFLILCQQFLLYYTIQQLFIPYVNNSYTTVQQFPGIMNRVVNHSNYVSILSFFPQS